MILHTLLLISSLSFAADGSKYEGKTGRAAHESANKSEAKTPEGGAPTPITPTNGEKTENEDGKPKKATEDEKPKEATEDATKTPETAPVKKNKKKKNKKNAEKSEDNTMLFVGGGVLALGAVIALLLGRKKEE
jgi:hypothetical protein